MEVWNRLTALAARLRLKKTGEFFARNACLDSYNVLAFAFLVLLTIYNCVLGLKRLRREVRTCEYEDVRVLWDMLTKADAEIARSSPAARKRKGERLSLIHI